MTSWLVGSAQAPPLDAVSAVAFAVLACVAVVSLDRSGAALTLLLASIPFNFARAVGSTTIDAPKVVLVALAIALVARGAGASLVPKERELRLLAVAGVAVALLDLAGAPHASQPGASARESLKALQYVATLVVAAALVRGDELRSARIAMTIAAIAGAVSIVALADEIAPARSVVTIGARTVTRIAGPLEGPNQLAGYLQLLIPVLVVAVPRARGAHRAALAIASAIASCALLLTFSRSGVATAGIAIAIALGLASTDRSNRRAGGFMLAAAAVGAVVAAPLVFASRSLTLGGDERPTGLATRRELWHAAIVLWRRHPVFGIGAGNYEVELSSTGLLGVRTHANNFYLQTLAEGGIVSLAVACALFAFALVALWRRGSSRWLATGVFAATVGILAHQGFDDLFFFPKVGDTWWALLGVALASSAAAMEDDADKIRVKPGAAKA